MLCFRFLISDFDGGSLLRIEPVRKKRESGAYECVAENGVGDEVSVSAELEVYDGETILFHFIHLSVILALESFP